MLPSAPHLRGFFAQVRASAKALPVSAAPAREIFLEQCFASHGKPHEVRAVRDCEAAIDPKQPFMTGY